jgi:hypothetical protein
MGSTSLQPQDFLYEISSHSWTEEYGSNDDVELYLDGAHASLAPVHGLFDIAIPFSADSFMHSESRFCSRFHRSFRSWRFGLFFGFLLDSLYDLKHFSVWACAKVLQDGIYQVG